MQCSSSHNNFSSCIALIDMDCFYVQVEERLQPHNKGKPGGVLQVGGGLIAVNYEARALGIRRGMRPSDIKAICEDTILYNVPEVRQKADLARYRGAGSEVLEVFCSFGAVVERASIDEAYIDLTALVMKNGISVADLGDAFVEGHASSLEFLRSVNWKEQSGDCLLARGADIMMRMRAKVLETTGFTCSAGIAHNKVVAKLAAGLHKPNKLTIVPHSSVPTLFTTVDIRKVRNLGGKLGEQLCERFSIRMMSEIVEIPLPKLISLFGEKSGRWLYALCRGFDSETVEDRRLAKSIGCAKTFPGKNAILTIPQMSKWTGSLCEELQERMVEDRKKNKRAPRLLVVGNGYQSKSVPLTVAPLSRDQLYSLVMGVLMKICIHRDQQLAQPIGVLQFNVNKFEAIDDDSAILKFMRTDSDPKESMVQRLSKLLEFDEDELSLDMRF